MRCESSDEVEYNRCASLREPRCYSPVLAPPFDQFPDRLPHQAYVIESINRCRSSCILPKGGDSLDLQLDEDTPNLTWISDQATLEPFAASFNNPTMLFRDLFLCAPRPSHLHLPLMNLVDTVDGECRHLIPFTVKASLRIGSHRDREGSYPGPFRRVPSLFQDVRVYLGVPLLARFQQGTDPRERPVGSAEPIYRDKFMHIYKAKECQRRAVAILSISMGWLRIFSGCRIRRQFFP